nr:ribonuclease H-like domain-containing protein [Tanacetum cinerariifolium]
MELALVDTCKKGLGYENYNVVPPPYTRNFMPPKSNLSFTGLDEFANKPVVENSKAESSQEKPKEVKKNTDALIIKEWVSNDEDEEMIQSKSKQKTVKTVLVNTTHPKSTVNAAKHMSYLSKSAHSSVKRNIQKNTSFNNSNVNQRINTVRSKIVNTARKKEVVNAVHEDMLPLEVTPKEGKSLAKNSVLFNDTEYKVLSPDFKLIDESQVLLKVPRKNNMYSVDLKNIVPKGGLTSLFAKSTSDESKLWHRRLGHLNFKTINKLVKGNLIREAVNTACYVQNKVLVVKPHNKTPYKLFHGRTLTLSFMRPFGCPVTILNTLDHLGKFDGKTDEGFFVRYSMNSKAFRVFNNRKRIVEENLHIRFSESTPNDIGSGPDWLFDIDAITRIMNYEPIVTETQSNSFVGTKASDNACQARKGKEPIKDYILLPLWTADPPFSHDLKSSQDDGFKPQVMMKRSINGVNTVSENISSELPFNSDMSALEDISTFNFLSDHEDDDELADINNLDTTIQVSHVPTTRVHKDHPLDQVIRDFLSATQTRNMLKNLEEHGFVSTIQQRTNHKDLQNCLFAYFLSQEEPRKLVMYQMDVKSAFLYRKIKEELYVCQPPGFKDLNFPDKVYKVEKALYGLHLAPRACQDKYVAEILKKFGFTEVKNASTPIKTQNTLLKDEDGEEVDVYMYRSMIGSLMYLTSSRPDIKFARRVKNLEKKQRSITHKLKRLYKVGLTAKVESSDDEPSLGKDASKQGRISDIADDEGITIVSTHDDAEMFDVDLDLVQVSTAATTPTILIDEVTLVQALAELKHTKPKAKAKWIIFHELDESTTTTKATISKLKSQDNGKAIMIKELVKLKKKDQIQLDEKTTLKLQAELQAEFDKKQRLAREKAQKELEANIALIETWDEVQTKIDSDYQLDKRLQAEEQQELTDEEKAKLFMQLLEKRRKAFKRVNTFVDFKIELVEGSSKKVGKELAQERSNKQKVDDDKEAAELKKLMEIILDKEDVVTDAIPLAIKSPKIVDWKIHKEGKKSYYQIIRVDENSKMYMVFNRMLKEFDREDLEDLYSLKLDDFGEEYQVYGRIVGIQSDLNAGEITTAHIDVNTTLRS